MEDAVARVGFPLVCCTTKTITVTAPTHLFLLHIQVPPCNFQLSLPLIAQDAPSTAAAICTRLKRHMEQCSQRKGRKFVDRGASQGIESGRMVAETHEGSTISRVTGIL